MATAIGARQPAPPAERLRKVFSYSEQLIMRQVLDQMPGNAGSVVASVIADRNGVTRSVLVNAFAKAEAAGVLTSVSMGMKGTRLVILDRPALEEAVRE